MNRHIMLDLETLDTKSSAIVVSIGAVSFDDEFNELDRCDIKLDLESQEKAGRTISSSTFAWWTQQSDDARKLFSPEVKKANAQECVLAFQGWSAGLTTLWGNGSDFDNTILASLFDSFGCKKWSFSRNRCFRTMKNLPLPREYIAPERVGTHHDALDDAVYQLHCLKAICTALKIKVG